VAVEAEIMPRVVVYRGPEPRIEYLNDTRGDPSCF